MESVIEQTFLSDDMGVCVKDTSGKVLQQNALCLDICGDCSGDVCEVACMELYAKDESQQWQNWGSRVYKNSFAHHAYYDITLLCTENRMITFLQPLKEKYKMALSYYEQLNLTKRETEIISLIIQGVSNLDICEKLSISKATIKTHLNNIYKKVSDQGIELKYIPKNRLFARVE